MEELNGVSYICGAHFHLCFMLWEAKIKTDPLPSPWASLVVQMVKNLSAMQPTGVQSLGQDEPPGKGMATHSSILGCRIPWTEEPGGLQSMGSQRAGHD